MYEVIAEPWFAGGVKETIIVELLALELADTLVGASGISPATEPVELEVPVLEPWLLVPVTTQLTALPTSASTKAYVLDVAPLILEPARFHWYANVIVAVPVQVPVVEDKV